MNTSEVKKYSKGLVNSIKSGSLTLEEAVIESSTKTGCTKDYARKILNDYLKSGYSNNPDYVGDWFGKGQIDFDAIINPEDDGDVWMVKMWSGSGYTLDVYLCKATNIYDAIDTVFEWSWENEGENNMVFDLDYINNECREEFEKHPDYFGDDLSDDYEEFEMRWFEDYIGSENGYYARSENFFVDKVPENVLAENQKPVQNSRKSVKSSADNLPSEVYYIVVNGSRQYYEDYDEADDNLETLRAIGKGKVNGVYTETDPDEIYELYEVGYIGNSRRTIK